MLNKALLASPKEFRISIGTQTHCSVQLSKTSAMPGDKITVTVNPATGYGNTTVGISTNGSVTKVNNTTFTFIMPFTDVVVNASASILSFRINVNKQGSGNVNVKSVANYGEVVTVSFSPGEDYKFGSISISGVGLSGSGNSRTFTMPAHDVTINVVFSELYPGFTPCTITINIYNRVPSTSIRRRCGYSNEGLIPGTNLVPALINNLFAYRFSDNYTNYFDTPVYINGTLLSNDTNAKQNYDFLMNLYNSGTYTYKCYVKTP